MCIFKWTYTLKDIYIYLLYKTKTSYILKRRDYYTKHGSEGVADTTRGPGDHPSQSQRYAERHIVDKVLLSPWFLSCCLNKLSGKIEVWNFDVPCMDSERRVASAGRSRQFSRCAWLAGCYCDWPKVPRNGLQQRMGGKGGGVLVLSLVYTHIRNSGYTSSHSLSSDEQGTSSVPPRPLG
jgi:hypothetical protein